jgi:hypothetical protein
VTRRTTIRGMMAAIAGIAVVLGAYQSGRRSVPVGSCRGGKILGRWSC